MQQYFYTSDTGNQASTDFGFDFDEDSTDEDVFGNIDESIVRKEFPESFLFQTVTVE